MKTIHATSRVFNIAIRNEKVGGDVGIINLQRLGDALNQLFYQFRL